MTERLTKDDTYRICCALDAYANDLMRLANRDDSGFSEVSRQSMRDQASEVIGTLRKYAPRLAKTDVRYFVQYMD
jgi:hypothetical protein